MVPMLVLALGLAMLLIERRAHARRWLGYLIQHPGSHCVHDREGLHRDKDADLPVSDMLFGTFRNPRGWNRRCGFRDGPKGRGFALLTGQAIGSPERSGGPK